MKGLLVPALLICCLTAACGAAASGQPTSASPAEIPNPASVNCEENGGTLEIRTAADGSQSGACVFADGSECDEWAFFRGECQPGQSSAPTGAPAVTPRPTAASEPLALSVLTPVDETVATTPQIEVTGTTSPGAVVTVNDEILIAGEDGSFTTLVVLEEGPNLIEILASNEAGNEAYVQLVVTYQP